MAGEHRVLQPKITKKSLAQNHPTTKTSMAPPPLKASRYDTNRDIALLSNLGMGYKKIAKEINLPVSTVHNVVKRYQMRGSIQDTPRSGRPVTKRTPEIQQRIETAVEENPWDSLREITDSLKDLNIGQTTVNKVIGDLGFKLRIPRKKPYLDAFTKIRRKYWCRWRVRLPSSWWHRAVWLDETGVEFTGTYQPGKKVRI